MARSYLPSKVSEIVAIWRKDLQKVTFCSCVFFPLFLLCHSKFGLPDLGRNCPVVTSQTEPHPRCPFNVFHLASIN